MFEFYKKLMILSRHSVEISLMDNNKEEANFINDFINEWGKIKTEMLSYITKMKDSWKKETDIKEDLGYLG